MSQEYISMLEQQANNINKISDDTKRLRHLIGEKVQTPDGIGILLGHKPMDFNGLYFTDNSYWQVWYGMNNVQNRKVSWVYSGIDIAEIK